MSKKLPAIRFVPRPDWQKKRLAAWLEEWNLEQNLRRNDDGERPSGGPHIPVFGPVAGLMGIPILGFMLSPALLRTAAFAADIAKRLASEKTPDLRVVGTDEEAMRKLVREFDRPVAVGQVRLLSPELTSDTDRPVFVAVFGDWDEGEVLMAPFGPFSVPATTGEWLTGRTTPVLRVLEVWNARSVPNTALDESWLVDDFAPAECKAAWHVFEHEAFRKPLAPEFEQQVGPPLVHPEDPRRRYQDEEVALLATFHAVVQGLQETPDVESESDAPPEGGRFGEASTVNTVGDPSEDGEEEAYAASTEEPPPLDNLSADDLLPGFQGEAERDCDAPAEASILRLAFHGPESPRPAEVPTGGVTAEWPGGQSGPHDFEYRAGAWWAQIRLNLPWPRTVVLLQEKKIRIKPVP